MSIKPSTRDNILYLTIACAILGLVAIMWWYQEAHGLPLKMPISEKQFKFLFSTALIFGYAIRQNRRVWKYDRFWIVLAVTFAVFVPAQWLFIEHIKLTLITFGLVSGVELLALLTVLEKLVPHHHRLRSTSSDSLPIDGSPHK